MTQQQKIFAVGDIHGNFEKLSRLIPRLPFDQARGDTLVFMGDYINRGPQTADVIAYLIELKQRLTKVVFLMGNHEHTLLMYAKTGEEGLLQLLRHMKVEETLNSYHRETPKSLSDLSFLPDAHRDFLTTLLPYYLAEGYLFVHAGLGPGKRIEDQQIDTLVGSRTIFHDNNEDKHDYTVVFGHIPFEMPLVTPNFIGIDTGASYGNQLTAVELPTLRFYHA